MYRILFYKRPTFYFQHDFNSGLIRLVSYFLFLFLQPVIPANLDLTNLSSVLEALTNLQKINSINKTVAQQEVTSNAIMSPVQPELPPEPSIPELPKHEPPR